MLRIMSILLALLVVGCAVKQVPPRATIPEHSSTTSALSMDDRARRDKKLSTKVPF